MLDHLRQMRTFPAEMIKAQLVRMERMWTMLQSNITDLIHQETRSRKTQIILRHLLS